LTINDNQWKLEIAIKERDSGMRRRSEDAPAAGARPTDSRRRAPAKTIEDISLNALELARRARAAGFATVGHMLEQAALEAASEATARRWPTEN
jgi:hypothetical protein